MLADNTEAFCNSNPLFAGSLPERVDTPGDDNGDTLVNEVLPAGSDEHDCDGDGYTGAAEAHVFAGAGNTAGDQDPCGTNGWPADLASAAPSTNRITLMDMTSFVAPAPRKLDKSPGDAGYDVRWDVVPGAFAGKHINLLDMTSLTTVSPAMLAARGRLAVLLAPGRPRLPLQVAGLRYKRGAPFSR